MFLLGILYDGHHRQCAKTYDEFRAYIPALQFLPGSVHIFDCHRTGIYNPSKVRGAAYRGRRNSLSALYRFAIRFKPTPQKKKDTGPRKTVVSITWRRITYRPTFRKKSGSGSSTLGKRRRYWVSKAK